MWSTKTASNPTFLLQKRRDKNRGETWYELDQPVVYARVVDLDTPFGRLSESATYERPHSRITCS
ncbi:hypothetical protein BN2476_630037 [Paraburkholderia piptadeniae]|uniref:Uncharacterized protein n=1 Tax=Paraburkholderia piptadeniae TaxID=1701573 RepID=A0A1N7SLB1_9BURK|nr:hypothetical protein BN2476_630037 [Paraburkholderia piptadeniae]